MPGPSNTFRLEAGLPERVARRVQLLVDASPDPVRAFRCLARLRQESPGGFERIAGSTAALRSAVALFSYSNFLGEGAVRNPERILELVESGTLYRVLGAEEHAAALEAELGAGSGIPEALLLARFRRRQLARIALRDVLGLASLSETTQEISCLADVILDAAYCRIRAALVARHGEPLLEDGERCGFSVIALGKLGGLELNYSSDIDLMFLYGGNGHTDGPHPLTNREFYKKVANEYTALLSAYTPEGLCYRVDLRLRPDGTLGEVCISEEGARSYYALRARDWEKQMLIKARVAAGEPGPGAALLEFVEPLTYESSLDFRAVEAVSETRARIGEKMAARRAAAQGLDIKLTPGGIRDIEFLVQCLQRLHGGRERWVRHGGTLLALIRLRDKGLLSDVEYARLATAYQFLRNLEHRLQLEDDRQTHSLPKDPDRLALLARKMPRAATGVTLDAAALTEQLTAHLGQVRQIYERVIYAQRAVYDLPVELETGEEAEPSDAGPARPGSLPHALTWALDQHAPQLAELVASAGLQRGKLRFEHFLEKAFSAPEVLARLEANPARAAAVLDLFEHSPYFSNELLRYPELLDEIGERPQMEGAVLDSGAALRRYYRRQMLRIQCRSVVEAAPIFDTLAETSLLADKVIGAAYRIARGTEAPDKGEMMVIALGRLGMSEFDLGSDADLVFVIPDESLADQTFWTGIAERMIQIITAYTGEGVLFSIDTRLRPNGREGDLVMTEGAYKSYFAHAAEAWEGITYMKARAVAGNPARATRFLSELQAVDWRRYGLSMRSRDELSAMRKRLEREQGPRNPLKAGPGGYYDIDFALMYLRLRGAGIFYTVLNTPARIDVIEQMGHLEHQEAFFLREAATFFRAVDHGLRISTGHAEGSLPSSQTQMEVLTNLVRRWTPPHLHGETLERTLQSIRQRTRDFFNLLFGRSEAK
jgi:[glutamine synthetase] adenylyltransferase / [glutamine synthetase]-adenylyl-L-tyrosine phosphorylase